ncbi:hypothetical protein GDO78_020208, partial [Eleutherodactylus coqui]
MESPIQYILTAVLYVIYLLGLMVNLIIVAANAMKWKSLKSLQTCDKILISLAISRSLNFFYIIIWNTIFLFFPRLLRNNILLSILNILIMLTFYSSFWIATILCVFYCVRIVTYNYKLFVFLKTRISTMAPWLIQVSLLISLISSLPFGWYGYGLKLQNIRNENTTEYGLSTAQILKIRFLCFSLGSLPPFLIYCVANLLLIHFLLMHITQLRSNESHIQSPNLNSHFNALKSMSLFLVLQIMLFMYASIHSSGALFQLTFSHFIADIIACIPTLFHSLYMISSSREVKKMLTSM